MTYKELQAALTAALENVEDEDAEIIVVDENDNEYEIGIVEDDAGETLIIFVETKPDED